MGQHRGRSQNRNPASGDRGTGPTSPTLCGGKARGNFELSDCAASAAMKGEGDGRR